MKRALLAAVALLLASNAALAFDAKRHAPRVGVLRSAHEYGHGGEMIVSSSVQRYLTEELRERGVEAFDAGVTLEGLGERDDADFYVEIAGAGAESGSWGGVGVGGRDVGMSVEVIVSRVAAELRIYDGRTLQPLRSELLTKKRTAVMPTSIGIGGGRVYAFIAIPFVRWHQYRSAARDAARDAAKMVSFTLDEL